VKLNELLADTTLTATERVTFGEALTWVHATHAPVYVARLEA
jgi:hypothetical protein